LAKLEKNKKISKTPQKAQSGAEPSLKEEKAKKLTTVSTIQKTSNEKTKSKAKTTPLSAKNEESSKNSKTKKTETKNKKVVSKAKTTPKKTNKTENTKTNNTKTSKKPEKTSPKTTKPPKTEEKKIKKTQISEEKPDLPKKARKKKDDKNTQAQPAALNNSKKIGAINKLKSSKLAGKKIKAKKDPEDEEEILEDLDTLSLDLDGDIDILPPVKRRPGRPAKQKDQITSKLIDFPSSVRLPKRQSTKPKRTLSTTIPGSALAQLLSVGDLVNSGKTVFENKIENKEEIKKLPPFLNLQHTDIEIEEEIQALPSWTPRNWVTREGERLIIRGQELLKEEQFGNLETETPSGVISQEEVDEVIRRIRDSYKKKSLSKKSNSI
jgi:hypothetical protein